MTNQLPSRKDTIKHELEQSLCNCIQNFNIHKTNLTNTEMIKLGNTYINNYKEQLINIIDSLTPSDFFNPKRPADEILFKTILSSTIINNTSCTVYAFESNVELSLIDNLRKLNGALIQVLKYNYEDISESFNSFYSAKDIYNLFLNKAIVKNYKNYHGNELYVSFKLDLYFLHPFSIDITISKTAELKTSIYNPIITKLNEVIKKLAYSYFGVEIDDSTTDNGNMLNYRLLDIPSLIVEERDNSLINFTKPKEYYTDEVIIDNILRYREDIVKNYLSLLDDDNKNRFLFSLFKSIIENRNLLDNKTHSYTSDVLLNRLKNNKVSASSLCNTKDLINENNLTVNVITALLSNNPNYAQNVFDVTSDKVLNELFTERPGFMKYANEETIDRAKLIK